MEQKSKHGERLLVILQSFRQQISFKGVFTSAMCHLRAGCGLGHLAQGRLKVDCGQQPLKAGILTFQTEALTA